MKACTRFLMLLIAGLTVGSSAMADLLVCNTAGKEYKIILKELESDIPYEQDMYIMRVYHKSTMYAANLATHFRKTIEESDRYTLDFSIMEKGKLIPHHFELEETRPLKGGQKGYLFHFLRAGQSGSLTTSCYVHP